ncbi:Cardioactive peptide [Frankliniella fusca]|uniref:Cardioactive peptide n=1 Tax=Frankliniella fusca TaxID=407009 RepID=A0AAE1LM77_9NEOP|nr:Cardioactive peptide [Frankliniella fusca]
MTLYCDLFTIDEVTVLPFYLTAPAPAPAPPRPAQRADPPHQSEMQLAFVLLSAVLCCCLTSLALTRADDTINAVDLDSYDDERAKRPFCNAFTGCGRKRSASSGTMAAVAAPPARPLPLRADDPMTTLFDLNAEPAVAELSRQILSEAKLWEAIREASRDEGRRQQQHSLEVGQPAESDSEDRALTCLRPCRTYGGALSSLCGTDTTLRCRREVKNR